MMKIRLLTICILVIAATQSHSEEMDAGVNANLATTDASAQELAKLKQNPVSGLRQLILTADVSPDVPYSDDPLSLYSLQLVWPFALNEDWRMITYSILPVIDLPGPAGQDSTTGFGNVLLNFFVAPNKPGNFVWGAGPAVSLPTHTKKETGSDQVGVGPSAILFYAEDVWSAGVVLQNIWSIDRSSDDDFNVFGAQYIFNYNLDDGLYLYSNATITSNWDADSDNRWTVPVSGGVGKIFNVGTQPVSASFQLYSNVVKPDESADWGLNFQLSFLYP